MIYLVHPETYDTRACETERTALEAERSGFIRIPPTSYREHRRLNDLERLDRLRHEDAQERARLARTPIAAWSPRSFV